MSARVAARRRLASTPPMMILAGERQLGQRVSPNCEQNVRLGVAQFARLCSRRSSIVKSADEIADSDDGRVAK
jgi:hypothetical protein